MLYRNLQSYKSMKIENISFKLGSEKIKNRDLLSGTLEQQKIDELLEKIGIETRYKCSKEETIKDLAIKAVRKIADKDNFTPDLIISITQTSPFSLPHLSAFIEGEIFKNNIGSFDINLGCSGFVYGLIILDAMMEKGLCKKPLLVCADSYNKNLNNPNNSAYLIFSDAATSISFSDDESIKFLSSDIGTDGTGVEKLILKNSTDILIPEIYMDGPAVMLFTMNKVIKSINSCLEKAQLTSDDINFFLFHQASNLVLEKLKKKLKINHEKVPSNLKNLGNTTSCTIPLLINDLKNQKQLKSGQKILMSGFGVGLSWATCIIEI